MTIELDKLKSRLRALTGPLVRELDPTCCN